MIAVYIYNREICMISKGGEGSSLGQSLIKIKHDREMAGKLCPNLKFTSPCTLLPQYNYALAKDKITYGFYTFLKT